MRTIHFGLRVADARRSTDFYTAVGYAIVGRVPDTPIGELTMLKLPADEFVTIELVYDADATDEEVRSGGALSHLVIATDSMADTIALLTGRGIDVKEPTSPDGSDEFLTSMISDPDGNHIEIVQWPPGHPAGFTGQDFAG
jgi:lactoylglutathione lyase